MHKLVITGSNKAEFIEVDIPKISSKQILVKTICTAISTGTEIRVYNGISIDKNSVHGSDSPENAKAEIDFFFN